MHSPASLKQVQPATGLQAVTRGYWGSTSTYGHTHTHHTRVWMHDPCHRELAATETGTRAYRGVGTQLENSTRLHQGRQHAHGAWGQHGFLQASPALLLPRDLEDGGVTTTGPAMKATATPSRSQGEPTKTGGEDPSEEDGRHVGQHRAAGAQPRLQGNPRSALEEATQLRHTVLLGARHREQGGSSPTRSFLTSLLLFTPQSTKETHQSCQPPCGYRGLQFPLGPVEGVAHNCRKRDSEVLLPPASPPPCPETCSQAGGFASFLPSAPGTASSLLPPKHSKQSPPCGVGSQKGHIFPTTAAGPLANRSLRT